MTGRGGRREQLLDDLKEVRGHWKLEEKALDLTLWRTGFGTDMDLSKDKLCVDLPLCVTTSLKCVCTNTLAVSKAKCRIPRN